MGGYSAFCLDKVVEICSYICCKDDYIDRVFESEGRKILMVKGK